MSKLIPISGRKMCKLVEKIGFEKDLPKLKRIFQSAQQDTDVELFIGIKGQKTAYDLLFAEVKKVLGNRAWEYEGWLEIVEGKRNPEMKTEAREKLVKAIYDNRTSQL